MDVASDQSARNSDVLVRMADERCDDDLDIVGDDDAVPSSSCVVAFPPPVGGGTWTRGSASASSESVVGMSTLT